VDSNLLTVKVSLFETVKSLVRPKPIDPERSRIKYATVKLPATRSSPPAAHARTKTSMIKSNPSLVKRRVKRQRPCSASAVIRRSVRAVIGVVKGEIRSAASVGSSWCPTSRQRCRLAGCIALVSLLLIGVITSGTAPMRVLRPNRLELATDAIFFVGESVDSELNNSIPYHFPQVVNLWPNDGGAQDEGKAMPAFVSCTDEDAGNDPCRLSKLNDEAADTTHLERVGILRVPGRLGSALENAVRIMIVNQTKASSSSAGARSNVELLPTSFVETVSDVEKQDGSKYSRIIRIATQPLLLDVIDLALDASESKEQISTEDLLCILRLLVQWHCHHNDVATAASTSETVREQRKDAAPVLTLSAQLILSHPSEVRKQLSWFLNRKARDVTEKRINEWMDDVSHRILERVDECSATATALLQRRHPQQDLHQMVQAVVREEAAICSSHKSDKAGQSESLAAALTTARCDARGDSQLVEIAEILLSVPEAHDLRRKDSTSLCGRFPDIQFCLSHLTKQPLQPVVEQQ
jgi:hypothetical protein